MDLQMASHLVGSRRCPRAPPPPGPPPAPLPCTAQDGGNQQLIIIGMFCLASFPAISMAGATEFIPTPPPPRPPRARGALEAPAGGSAALSAARSGGGEFSSGCQVFHGMATRP